MQNVEFSKAEISIFSSVVNSMIVISESPCILAVRIVVVLVLANLSRVVGPAIEGGPTVRSVKVYAGSSDAVVDKSNNSFTAFCRMEGRTGNNSIIANPSGLAKIRVDLRLGLIDVHLVVVNSISCELQAVPPPLASLCYLEWVSVYTRLPNCSHAKAYEIDTENSISAHIR